MAAAHSACFAMSLANEIGQAAGFILTAVRLTAVVEAEGLDEAGFRRPRRPPRPAVP